MLTLPCKRLTGLLQRQLKQQEGASSSDKLLTPSNRLDALVVLDRRVDMITPLLTQLTYEGLIDETLGIKNCKSISYGSAIE